MGCGIEPRDQSPLQYVEHAPQRFRFDADADTVLAGKINLDRRCRRRWLRDDRGRFRRNYHGDGRQSEGALPSPNSLSTASAPPACKGEKCYPCVGYEMSPMSRAAQGLYPTKMIAAPAVWEPRYRRARRASTVLDFDCSSPGPCKREGWIPTE